MAIGFGPSMADADVISFEYFAAGGQAAYDRFSPEWDTPEMDATQSVTLTSFTSANNVNTFTITRALNTGDSMDKVISTGVWMDMTICWLYANEFEDHGRNFAYFQMYIDPTTG